MAEYVGGEPMAVDVGDPITFENKTELRCRYERRSMMDTEWLKKAIDAIKSGLADKLIKDDITVYRVVNIIRIDIKINKE